MKKIIVIMIALLLITGSASKKVAKSTKKNTMNENQEQSIYMNQEKSIAIETSPTVENELAIVDNTDLLEKSSIEVVNYVENLNTMVNNITNTSSLSKTAKIKLKEYFIILTDFIFYKGEINGITFEDLSLSAKQRVLEIYILIDERIEAVWPNYKETIKDTAQKAYTDIKEKALYLKETLKEKYKDSVGDDVYNDSIQIFEEDLERLKDSTASTIDFVKEKSKNAYESIKNTANNWYQNFKESSD